MKNKKEESYLLRNTLLIILSFVIGSVLFFLFKSSIFLFNIDPLIYIPLTLFISSFPLFFTRINNKSR